MSDKAERWLAEQESAMLERIYALPAAPEHDDERDVIGVEARKVRLWRPGTHGPQPNGTIRG